MESPIFVFFFFNDTATTEIYTLSLHDALPIYFVVFHHLGVAGNLGLDQGAELGRCAACRGHARGLQLDRKSTRLNSSHGYISYAVFCLKKKTEQPACTRGAEERMPICF